MFKDDNNNVAEGTYTKSGSKITGKFTSGPYKGWDIEVDTSGSAPSVKIDGVPLPGFGEVTTPRDPDEPEVDIDHPDYLEVKGSAITGLIEDKLPADGAVEIPEDATAINANAFYGKTKIKSVTIPGTVTQIGAKAFYGCTNLTTVSFTGDGLKVIGEYAFSNCTSLKSVNIPGTVTTINSGAFCNCSALKGNITIPAGVTKIPGFTFGSSTAIESVTFTDTEGWWSNPPSAWMGSGYGDKPVDVSNPEKNAENLKDTTYMGDDAWGHLGIYKKTN